MYEKYADLKILYNLWCPEDNYDWADQLGILHSDYTPKLAYYTMKYFYENTNGSEYIGQINLGDGIEAHVYDKEGKVKIIAWTNSPDETYEIKNENYDVYDVYGNLVSGNNITVYYDPIYINNASDKYFFQAISMSLINGYDEFEELYGEEINKIDGLQEKVNTLKNYANSLYDIESESEETAENKMLAHFQLGKLVLNAYKEGIIENVTTVSGMLDSLNEIGDSFEDLITVTAKTRKTNLDEVNNNISEAEQIINNNKIDILYSNKILDYAEEFRDTSEYILSLDEENAIKTGLINSKAIHANELAKWSSEFSEIQIEKKIYPILENIKEQYNNILENNTTLLSNPSVTENYNTLINFIDNYEYTSESIEQLNDLYIKLELSIIDIYLNNTLVTVSESDIDLLLDIEKVSENFIDLIENYINNTDLDLDELKNLLNNSINKYNENKDNVDLNISYNLLNSATDLYNNKLQNDDEYLNYLNAQRIRNIVELSNYTVDKAIEVKNYVDSQKKEITISYSTSSLTNNSVTAYINLPEGSVIQNNSGKNQYIFEENKSFDFIIIKDGITYSITASTTNIIEDYLIKDNNIMQINKNTIIKEFIDRLNILNCRIIRSNKELSNNDKIATGDILIYNNQQYNLIVNGDINSDGDVTIHDLITMRKFLVESKDVSLNDQEKLAADTDQSGIANINDLINIRKIIVK